MAKLGPNETMAVARLNAKRIMPYLADAILALIPREAPGLGTMGVTDGMLLLWDPETVVEWGPDKAAWVLLHECAHPLRRHSARCKHMLADPAAWNVCADMEINDDLVAVTGCDLPDGGGILPKNFGFADGQLAETYYDKLRQQAQQQGAKGKGSGEGDGDGDGEGEGGAPGQGPSKPAAGKGWCGSAGGHAVPGEPQAGQGDGGRSEIDVQRVRMQVAEAIRQHAQQGRSTVPGGWLAWSEQFLLPARINWRDKLARAVRSAVAHRSGAVDYTYRRPSRRQGAYGFGPRSPIRPSLHAPVPRVAVGVDTSGSMGEEGIRRAASEVAGILKAINAEVEFVACDCRVHEQRKVRSARDLAALFKGGGGTSFVPAFEAVAKGKPGVFVFITDGQGDAPATQPAEIGRVIWVLVGEHREMPHAGTYGSGARVAYGDVIEIDD